MKIKDAKNKLFKRIILIASIKKGNTNGRYSIIKPYWS